MDTIKKFKQGKFDIEVKTETDDYPDTSWIGHFSNSWEFGAIDRKRTRDYSRHEYRYFIPTCGCDSFKNQKTRKDKAYFMKSALLDHRYFEDLNNGNKWFNVVVVTASIDGIELGFDSLGGVESDYDIDQCLRENGMVENAIESAKTELKKLQAIAV